MRAADGTLLGILSVDEPVSGRRPSGDETEVLVAVAEHAALAVQAAQEATQAHRHREALERLLEVSTRLTGFFWKCVHPADRERVAVEVERTHSIGERFRAEYRLLAAGRRVVWVLDETVAVRDEEFRPLFLQGFLLEVTDRRPTERQLTAVAASA
jgi:GAF domain-containing protein